MRVSVKWLKDYIDITVSPEELARRLTMAGNEVKAVETIGAGWENNVVIGQIKAVNPHPNADRLRLATVFLGHEDRTVVCGAPNLRVGDKIVFASVGARLKDGHTGETVQLKPVKIRGIESAGMVCSEMELGISQEKQGILVLPPEAPLGMSLMEYMGDSIIDLDVTPNRPDCLSVIGIAREAAALTQQKIHINEPSYMETAVPISEKISIEIFAPDLCPRYSASLVTGVKIKPSPTWLQDRIIASGMRPINNIVDISNYVMLEYGQPLHTFDYDKIKGQKIIVRRAVDGENLISLDDNERKLNSNMLVIADIEKAVAIAGVMGGANSEVSEQTASILIEAANFNPVCIRRTGDALNLPSEARYRFERGISPGITLASLKRATELIAELGEGTAAKGFIDLYPGKKPVKPITLSLSKMKRFLGVEFTEEQVKETLASLGFDFQNGLSNSELMVIAPYWRSDISIEVDLMEEVARILGYDKIPNTLLAEPLVPQNPDPLFTVKRETRLGFAAAGFSEVLNFSMIGLDMLNKLSPEKHQIEPRPIRVANPMTADMECLRVNLRSTLLTAFAANRRYEDGSIRLFEVGKVYLPDGKDFKDERDTGCGIMGGQRFAKSWQDNDKLLDFYDAKGTIEGLLLRLGLNPVFKKGQDASLHPNKQAAVFLGDQRIGVVGEVHPKVLASFEINEPVYLLEVDIKTLIPYTTTLKLYKAIPRFPSIVRDMAFIVDMRVTNQNIRDTIQGFPLVEQVEVFDLYVGEQVPTGKKSLAYRISYRSPAHTLTDDEVNQIQQQILARLSSELGAVLRG
jgi:phenylalanyl-tRNA synthetase beta chain